MAHKIKNPLAQALGLVFQGMRDKMGGVSSSDIASMLGLAASHYRMIEAGSAILQPSRAIRIVQTFDTIEFVPLCQVLVCQQILDSVKGSITDMRTSAELLAEASPGLSKLLYKLIDLLSVVENSPPNEVSRAIVSQGLKDELVSFLTTPPLTYTADQIDDFMSPTYQYPISGQLYS
ncbi:MAG: helix-turn-helix transcriptional regulator, partial [Anaerohalosphaera sp.]|nr:helix-turn-helix transcriptional regulator [Anaerohalosphaera sp.]